MTLLFKRLSVLACTTAFAAFTGVAVAQHYDHHDGHFGGDDHERFQQHYGSDAQKWAGRKDRPHFEGGQAIPRNYRIQPVPRSYWGGPPPPAGYSYGYYEVRMRVTDVPGVCASFFWIEAPKYGPREWDIEFLTNEPWITSENQGVVHLTLHPSNTAVALPLPFNPSKDFHRYGFLWKPGVIVFTVDGKAVHTFNETDLDSTAGGFIMANAWTGNSDWGGGPPSKQADTVYEWIKYTAGADSIIDP